MGASYNKRVTAGPGSKFIVVVPMSFVSGEQAANRVYFPYKTKVIRIRGIVTVAIAATDAGTVTAANSTGSMANGVLTFPLSSAINVEPAAVLPTTNFTVQGGGFVQLTSAKTTAGGKVLITLECQQVG